MQISPTTQNINNNETSFKRLIIHNGEKISENLLYEIAKNKELRTLAKYFHKEKADVFVSPAYRHGNQGHFIPTIDVYIQKANDITTEHVFEGDVTENAENVLKGLNANEFIKQYEKQQEYIKFVFYTLREKAEKMIEKFNNSLK